MAGGDARTPLEAAIAANAKRGTAFPNQGPETKNAHAKRTRAVMSYVYAMGDGRQLRVDQGGGQTRLALQGETSRGRQSQGGTFDTGEWSQAPALFEVGDGLVLRIDGARGARYLRMSGDDVELLQGDPDLAGAKPLELEESAEPVEMMEPLEPMKPMAPMRPMKPMRPMD